MTIQYTPIYQIPYPQASDPIKTTQTTLEAQAKKVEEIFGYASMPASNPDVASMTARLNALEAATTFRRQEFKNTTPFNVPANSAWGIGPIVADVSGNKSKGAAFATAGPGNDKITINENGWYTISCFIVPTGASGVAWASITLGSSDKVAQNGNNTNMWETMVTVPVPVYIAAGTVVVFSYVATAAHNINSKVTIAKVWVP